MRSEFNGEFIFPQEDWCLHASTLILPWIEDTFSWRHALYGRYTCSTLVGAIASLRLDGWSGSAKSFANAVD